MDFISGPSSIDVRLEGPDEVAAVRSAVRLQNDYTRLTQGEDAVSKYDQRVERWKDGSYSELYSVARVSDLEYLEKALDCYGDEYTTEEAVDHLLEIKLGETRISEAAKRYRLGSEAGRLASEIQLHITLKNYVEAPEDY